MEISKVNKRIRELIARKICEGLSDTSQLLPDEEQELEAWLRLSPDNRRFYQRLTNPNYAKVKLEKYHSIDIDRQWQLFKESIGLRPVVVRHRINSFYWKQIAAVVLLVLGLAGIGYYSSMKKGPYTTITEETLVELNIQPGGSNAILMLDDGSSVALGVKGNQVIQEHDGTVIKGNASMLSYTKQEAAVYEKPLNNRIVTPIGGEYNLVLSDGTRVYLNSQSSLTYPVRFGRGDRVVSLEGEGYFEVASDEQHPFIVKTKELDVKVTGTRFNVKAYSDENSVQTTLAEGIVSVMVGTDRKQSIRLRPDQQAEWQNGAVTVRNVDAELYGVWKDGVFVFRQERLEDIMCTLSRWYGMEVVFEDEPVKDVLFSGKLDRSGSIAPILSVLQSMEHIVIKLDERKIILSRR